MAANPALVAQQDGSFIPAPFQGEHIALARPGVEFTVDNIRSRSGKWSSKGTLWLTNLRLVVVAAQRDAETGLVAFEVPLAYITQDKFNQPIFACNNLAGRTWPVTSDGSAPDAHPPHSWAVYFKEGGVGTFLPLYYSFLSAARGLPPDQPMGGTARLNPQQAPHPQEQQPGSQPPQQQPRAAKDDASSAPRLVATAFRDPSDPSKLYLAQPVPPEDSLQQRPVYAPDYGKEEEPYQPTGLRP